MRYHNITKDDMLNGDGLRVVLWVSGCNHGCPGCHNTITWDINGGLLFDDAAKAELYAELEKDYISGITFSGGDPLHPGNRADIESLITEIRSLYPNKTIWLYTGYSFSDVSSLSLIKNIDVLVDGKFMKDEMEPKPQWRGSKNQKVIDIAATLKSDTLVLKYK